MTDKSEIALTIPGLMQNERVMPWEVEQRLCARLAQHAVIAHLAHARRVVAGVGRVDQALVAQHTLKPNTWDGVQRVEEAHLAEGQAIRQKSHEITYFKLI